MEKEVEVVNIYTEAVEDEMGKVGDEATNKVVEVEVWAVKEMEVADTHKEEVKVLVAKEI